jgi:hypothetical protein
LNDDQALALAVELRADVDRLKALPYVPADIKGAVEKTMLLLQYLIERGSCDA